MRLLNTTSLKLEYFVGDEIPKYAMLSHRWEAEEILFEDVQTEQWPQKKGIDKVKRACLRAKDDGFKYIWIDTCCIDKSSSAELSEAINSMFKWYHGSQVCYAYLFDVSISEAKTFTDSEWFTRGWTLQELIAPQQVHFFDSQWEKIGDRLSLLDSIVKVTGIDRRVLGRRQHHRYCEGHENRLYGLTCRCGMDTSSRAFRLLLSSFSVATRMSWASRRVTKRVEDQAYALLGLFNVNMPLLYGEGTKAFRRLQEEIIRTSNDQSILAGDNSRCLPSDITSEKYLDKMDDALGHLFPSQPRAFRDAADLERLSASSKYLSMTLTNHRLNIDLHMCPCRWKLRYMRQLENGWLGILACVYSDDYLSRPAILLDRLSSTEDDQHVFTKTRTLMRALIRISPSALPHSNREVEISDGGLEVWFNPSLTKTMNIDLLLHPPGKTPGMRTPAISINPAIGGYDDMTYQIRTSLPELKETPKGHIRDVTFLIRGFQEARANMRGLLAIDNGSSHGFFVAYGFLVHEITNPEARDSPKFDPWCRLLKWHRVVTDGEFIPNDDESANTLKDMVQFNNYSRNNLPASGDDVHPHDSMDWPGRPCLRAQVAMTPKTFLGQTVYKLDISVWRIDGSSETQGSGHGGRGSHRRSSRRRKSVIRTAR